MTKSKPFYIRYLRYNEFLMRACGILPYEKKTVLNYMLPTVTIIFSAFLALPAIYSLTFHWNLLTLKEKANILSIQVGPIEVLKVLVILPRRRKVAFLIRNCYEIWSRVSPDECKNQEMLQFAERSLFITYSFSVSIYLALFSAMITPFLLEFIRDENGTLILSKQLPYAAGVNHENEFIFNIWHLAQLPAGFFVSFVVIGLNSAILFFCLHGCSFAILCQMRYKQLKNMVSSDPTVLFQNSEITTCINFHQKIINYTREIDGAFTLSLLVQIVLSISAVCGYGFNFLFQEDERPKYAILIVAGFFELWLNCWPPHELQLQMQAIADSVYDLPWVDWPKKYQLNTAFIMARSQKIPPITAGKFADISIKTFTSILSTAFSFFSVLRQII